MCILYCFGLKKWFKMSDLFISYKLSLLEALAFPLLSTYGIRHMKKSGWKNKIIGAVELFPLLGPIASLVEGCAVAIFRAVAARKPHRFSPAYIERQAWKAQFKAEALQHLQRRGAMEAAAFPPLTPQQQQALTHALEPLLRCQVEGVTMHSQNSVWVFSLPQIPGKIFKIANPVIEDIRVGERIDFSARAREIIERENLHLLHLPRQELVQIDIDGAICEVLVEEEMDILQGFGAQRGLFQHCLSEPELRPFIQECARQLIIFILRSGYSDVRYDNNPLLSNGKGMALIDLDFQGPAHTGLVRGCAVTGDDGILNYLTSEMIEELRPLLRDNLSEQEFSNLHLDDIRTRLDREAEQKKPFLNFLKKKKIFEGPEKVKFKKGSNASERQRQLNDLIDEIARGNLGLDVPSERKFFIYRRPDTEILDRLKRRGDIFDWQAIENSFTGYYVWA